MSLGAYGVLANLGSPAAAAWAALSPRMRKHLTERLGWSLPAIEPGALWLHAASLGEGQAAAAVAAGASTRWPELPLLRTATSDTGRDQVLPVDQSGCLPLDLPWLQRRFIRRTRPRALVLVEGELWPGLISASRGHLPVAVLGLRVGEGTRRLARLAPGLFRGMASRVSSWSARDEGDAQWLRQQLGFEVSVIGDLKLEAPVPPPALCFEGPMLLAGSTRPGDEQALLRAWAGLTLRPQLVLAPRHAERFAEVSQLLAGSELRWGLRSELEGPSVPPELEVLVLDSVGELASLYHLADAAFVGGTFDPAVGGHSAAEAVRAGTCVVHGPHTSANAASFRAAQSFPASGPEQLREALRDALAAPRPAAGHGQAVQRALSQLEPLAAARVPAEASHRPLARPLVPAYRLVAGLRARRDRLAAPCPVISVGALASGGTGKTPVVRHILGLLERRGLKVAVLSRGYRRSARGPHLREGYEGQGTALGLGDEPAMLVRSGAMVISCPDRLLGARRAVELGAQLCLLDDGFQQRDLQVDLDIVTIDAQRPLAGGMLPEGELREPLGALGRAGVVWFNHGQPSEQLLQHAGSAQIVQASTVPLGWVHRGAQLPLEAGPRGRVAVAAGIAQPGRLLRLLRRLGLVLAVRLLYRDHVCWDEDDLVEVRRRAGALPIVTTEKDLVRLPEDFPCWALRVGLTIEKGQAELECILERFLDKHGLIGEST